MRKNLLTLFIMLAAMVSYNAQIILEDNMDSYTLGAIGPQADHWTTWSGTEGGAEDGLVTDVQSFSTMNSMYIANTGEQDCVLLLGDSTQGVYNLSWKMYVDTTAYFNLQGSASIGTVFVYEILFNQNNDTPGVGDFEGTAFNFPTSSWFDVMQVIDLDNDIVTMYIDGVMVGTVPNTDNMSSIDFYSINSTNHYYIDDIVLTDVTPEPCVYPDAIICDNIDSYTADSLVAAASNGLWTTWSDAPGSSEDAYVSDSISFSGSNSIVLEQATTDLVLPFGNLTTGTYEFGSKMYFPAGHGGYFNMMHVFEASSTTYEWAIDVFFNGDGAGSTTAAGEADVAFTYPEDTWIDVVAIVDLDGDLAQMWIDGVMVREWQWSLINNTGAAGINQLAVADFYPAAVTGAKYYMDDVYFMEAEPLVTLCFMPDAMICDDFESYVADSLAALQSGGLWTTWSDAPGGAEDPFISDSLAYSGNNSVLLELASTDFVLPFGDLTTGAYEFGSKMYFPTGHGGYFNLMHVFEASSTTYEWAIDVFFNGDGTGSTTAAGEADVAFTYPEATWIDVNAIIDLDNDVAQMWVDGVMVREWQWSLVNNTGAAGTNQLAVADFYPAAVTGAQYFMDNVFFTTHDPIETYECFMPAANICDDFDAYIADSLAAVQSNGTWTTWSDTPGGAEDAFVSSAQSFSAPNSVVLEEATTDFVLPFGDLTTGAWEWGAKMYFPTGKGGYFNLMHVFEPSSNTFEWAIDVFFNGDGTGTSTAAGVADVAFTYPEATWIDVKCIVDLDFDLAKMYVDGNLIREWQWSINNGSGAEGTNQLAVADFYPAAVTGALYYMDNVYFIATDNLTGVNVAELNNVEFGVYPNPNNGSFSLIAQQTGNYTVQIIDVVGRVVYSETLALNKGMKSDINSDVTATGLYTVKLINQQSNEIQTQQIIVE